MKRMSSAELQPAQAVVQRMQALQLELRQARQHLRRERRPGDAADRWGLEQTEPRAQDEDWLITYLDMVTLLMVAMIVMLAFAAPIGKQVKSAVSAVSTMKASPPPLAPIDPGVSENLRSLLADQARIGAMRSAIGKPVPPPPPAPAVEAPTPEEPPVSPAGASAVPAVPADPEPAVPRPAVLSEGQLMADSLPLRQLGKDVEVVVNKRSVSFRVNSEILFGTGQADLSKEGLAVLKRMAQVLVNAGYDITVEGHTDSVRVRSSARYPSNWELSSARAGSVVRYLQNNGIPKSRLKAVGFADSHPIADNDTPEGRARNRRVELVISKHHVE